MTLNRTSRLVRRTPLRPISRKNMRREAELRRSKAIVRERSGGRCEFVGWYGHAGSGMSVCTRDAVHFHHTQPRSHGVDHRPENLLHLCHDCHEDIHHHPHWAYEHGYLMRSGVNG